MKNISKWFVYELEDGTQVGCFRIKPINDPEYAKAILDLKSIKQNENYVPEFLKAVARYLIQDWENIELNIDGIFTSKYTPDNAYLLFVSGEIGMNIASWVLDKAKSISFTHTGAAI